MTASGLGAVNLMALSIRLVQTRRIMAASPGAGASGLMSKVSLRPATAGSNSSSTPRTAPSMSIGADVISLRPARENARMSSISRAILTVLLRTTFSSRWPSASSLPE